MEGEEEKGGTIRRLLEGFDKRLDQGERLARLEERQGRSLNSDDARMIIDKAIDNDEKIEERLIERLNDFRSEMRGSFKHSDDAHNAAIFKANTDQENRLIAAITAMVDAKINAATTPPEQRRTFHPGGIAIGGLVGSLVTAVGTIITLVANGTLQVHH